MLDLQQFTKVHWSILQLFLRDNRERNYTEIYKETGIGYTSCLKTSKLLVNMGFLIPVDSGRYVLNDTWEGTLNLRQLMNTPPYVKPVVEDTSEDQKPNTVYVRPYDERTGRFEGDDVLSTVNMYRSGFM